MTLTEVLLVIIAAPTIIGVALVVLVGAALALVWAAGFVYGIMRFCKR